MPAGHWRWLADAAPFSASTADEEASPQPAGSRDDTGSKANLPCAYFSYHVGCCTRDGACNNFRGAWALNDGSDLQGFSELDSFLAGGRKLLVIGDSVSNYLGRSLACMGETQPAVDKMSAELPSGGRVDTVGLAQSCWFCCLLAQ